MNFGKKIHATVQGNIHIKFHNIRLILKLKEFTSRKPPYVNWIMNHIYRLGKIGTETVGRIRRGNQVDRWVITHLDTDLGLLKIS